MAPAFGAWGSNTQSLRKGGEDRETTEWIDGALARALLRRKHSLPIMLVVYERGPVCTSELIRCVRGHPESVIRTIRALQSSGVLSRMRTHNGRHEVETRLTVRGTQLVETPVYRWKRILLKWDRASD